MLATAAISSNKPEFFAAGETTACISGSDFDVTTGSFEATGAGLGTGFLWAVLVVPAVGGAGFGGSLASGIGFDCSADAMVL